MAQLYLLIVELEYFFYFWHSTAKYFSGVKLILLPLCTAFGIEMSCARAKTVFSGFNVERAKSGTKLTMNSDRSPRLVCSIAKCGLRLLSIAKNNSTTVKNRKIFFTTFHDRRKIEQWSGRTRKSLIVRWRNASGLLQPSCRSRSHRKTFSQHFSHKTLFSL